jgi:hypothetical protein
MTKEPTIRDRLFPSLTDVVFCTTLVFLFVMADASTALLKDSDTGWHIRTGEWILENHAVPRQDLFSFSKPGEQWFAWEWLSDVLFAVVHRHAGLAGLALLAGVAIALLYALLYRLIVARGASIVVAVPMATMASYAGSIHWLARPHMFSWLFALIFYWVLLQEPAKSRRLFWLAPLMVLWVNMHGSFLLGLFLIGVFGAAEVLRAVFTSSGEGKDTRREALERARHYGMVLAACGAASLLNPYSFRVHLHIAAYLRNDYILNHIGEFFSPNFRFAPAKCFEVMLVLGIGSVVWGVWRGRYAQALLVTAFAHFGLQSARHIPLYAIFAAPLIADALTAGLAAHRSEHLAGWLRRALRGIERYGADMRSLDLRPRVYAVSAAAALGIAALVLASTRAGTPERFRAQFNPKDFPVAAADYLERAGLNAKVFSTDQWASYFIYRFYPQVRVFMDGRSDYYGEEVGKVYLNVISVHYTWERTLNEYDINTVVLPANSSLAGAMKESRRWQVEYDDGVAIVFSRAAPPAASLVAARRANDRT